MLLNRRIFSVLVCFILAVSLVGSALAHDPLASRSTVLNTLIAASRTGSEIELLHNVTYTLNANLVITGLTINVPRGTLIQLGAFNLTANEIVAGYYKIFDTNSTGRVLGLGKSINKPEWFGALGDDSTDDLTAWNLCLGVGGEIIPSPGATYRVSGVLVANVSATYLHGSDNGSTIRTTSATADILQIGDGGVTYNHYVTVENIRFEAWAAAPRTAGAAINVRASNRPTIRNVTFWNQFQSVKFSANLTDTSASWANFKATVENCYMPNIRNGGSGIVIEELIDADITDNKMSTYPAETAFAGIAIGSCTNVSGLSVRNTQLSGQDGFQFGFYIAPVGIPHWETGDNNNQLSDYSDITGTDIWTNLEFYTGYLYFTIVDNLDGSYHVDIYSDSARSTLVAHSADYTGAGDVIISADGGSGLGGTLHIDAKTAADADISVSMQGLVDWNKWLGNVLDYGTDHAILIEPGASGVVRCNQFIGTWLGSWGINGVAVVAGAAEGKVDGLVFSTQQVTGNHHQGIYLAGSSGRPVKDISIIDSFIISNSLGNTGTYAGIEAVQYVEGLTVQGNSIGNDILYGGVASQQVQGVKIGGNTVTDILITNNRFFGHPDWDIWNYGGSPARDMRAVDNVTDKGITYASASTVGLPESGDVFFITGTTGITSIVASWIERRINLVFEGALTVTDGSNLNLNGNFVTTAGSVLTLVCRDGVNWEEVSRAGSGYTLPTAANWTDLTDAGATILHKHDHGAMDDLLTDDHTQYALLVGRAGGSTIIGGTAVTDPLNLQGTSGNGTATATALAFKVGNNGATTAGVIRNNGYWGIGTTSPLDLLSLSYDGDVVNGFSLNNTASGGKKWVIGDEAGTVVPGVFNIQDGSAAGTPVRWSIGNTGHMIIPELTTNPGTGDLAADAAVAIYTKADQLVFAYNNGGTITYIVIPLDGSTTTFTHSTSAP